MDHANWRNDPEFQDWMKRLEKPLTTDDEGLIDQAIRVEQEKIRELKQVYAEKLHRKERAEAQRIAEQQRDLERRQRQTALNVLRNIREQQNKG